MSEVALSNGKPPRRVPAPQVFPSYAVRSLLALAVSSPQLVLSVIPIKAPPSWLKWIVYLVLIFNIRSFPGLWHVHLFSPVVSNISKGRPFIPFIRRGKNAGPTTNAKTGRVIRHEALPLGKDIFEEKAWVPLRATPDDCDYMMHLSNSSYLKNLDYARTQVVFKHFFRFYSEGGLFHLGGSTIHYHREIPIGAKYEVRCEVASWDDKWVYLISYFTSPTDPATRTRPEPEPTSTGQPSPGISLSRSARDLRMLLSDVARPEHEAKEKAQKERQKEQQRSAVSTPMSRGGSGGGYFQSSASGSSRRHHSFAPPSDGTIYATAISRYTPKFKRKTIPPWLVVASSGFGTWASTRANWDKAEEQRERYAQGLIRLQRRRKGNEAASSINKSSKSDPAYVGFLKAFDPAMSRSVAELASTGEGQQGYQAGADDSSSWMRRSAWSLTEWEARRLEGAALVEKLGGKAPNSDVVASIVAPTSG